METFLGFKYVDGYRGMEFPPSPTRMLQAIIAGTRGDQKYLPLLHHLETKVPAIFATAAFGEVRTDNYRINNDERAEHNNAAKKKKQICRLADDLRVVYQYDIDPSFLPLLQAATTRVMALGRSCDFVIARAEANVDTNGLDRYSAMDSGSFSMTVPVIGFIDSVFRRYKNHDLRLRTKTVKFAKNFEQKFYALFELSDPIPREHASHVVSWIRHLGIPAGLNVSGHEDHCTRLQIVPVATLDWREHMIRRVIVMALDAAAARKAVAKLAGKTLRDENGQERGYITPADSDAVFADYLSASRVWTSVTPVIGMFDNGDRKQRMRNFCRMFQQADVPVPVRLVILPVHGDKSFVSVHHRHLPRFRVTAEFAEPVSGVVSVGTGRYAGLGIFANHAR